MSTGEVDPGAMGADPGGRQPTEEELRAAYEAEIAKVTIEQVLLEHVVTLINLGMRRTGLVPGTEAERDPTQVKVAIEAIRSQLPVLEQTAPQQISPIREALSQLQLAYVKIGGAPGPAVGDEPPEGEPGAGGGEPGPGEQAAPPPKPGEAGPAQRSGRLWVPGQ
jgi:hypothetical protein